MSLEPKKPEQLATLWNPILPIFYLQFQLLGHAFVDAAKQMVADTAEGRAALRVETCLMREVKINTSGHWKGACQKINYDHAHMRFADGALESVYAVEPGIVADPVAAITRYLFCGAEDAPTRSIVVQVSDTCGRKAHIDFMRKTWMDRLTPPNPDYRTSGATISSNTPDEIPATAVALAMQRSSRIISAMHLEQGGFGNAAISMFSMVPPPKRRLTLISG